MRLSAHNSRELRGAHGVSMRRRAWWANGAAGEWGERAWWASGASGERGGDDGRTRAGPLNGLRPPARCVAYVLLNGQNSRVCQH